ncbi:putative sulfate exporter family transporter [Gordonia jinghuaiqii]|uniref:Putative sulfate exporter family transporter n=1 Tax=Gordonia jinghuaiqii TaxID=2758710 RepID=A0A7D7LPY9_9ACTN|nr:putative sulfate exporter family transporter [Gordonia jinghuaiqii]MCR5976956.1 putative sulfate exporter family transporter [Gordonia jinghuaiqii]QMT00425.1 putative sulfate exporter family transporter [Gordonia jinghuaiqii]
MNLLRAAGFLAAGVCIGTYLHTQISVFGTLTWSVVIGIAMANLGLVPENLGDSLAKATKVTLRFGVALLGFSLPLQAVAGLGWGVVATAVLSTVITFVVMVWLGRRLNIAPSGSILIAAGTSICGASAIAGVRDQTDADDNDAGLAIGLITLFGTAVMFAWPLLQPVLGLGDRGYGIVVGSSTHEVGQVVAAASTAGSVALGVAILVKLTRVVLLAPIVAMIGVLRWKWPSVLGFEELDQADADDTRKRPPLIPLFVIAFLVFAGVRSTGVLPAGFLDVVETWQTAILAGAMFGLGAGVNLRTLFRSSWRPVLLAFTGTALISGLSLLGVFVLVR